MQLFDDVGCPTPVGLLSFPAVLSLHISDGLSLVEGSQPSLTRNSPRYRRPRPYRARPIKIATSVHVRKFDLLMLHCSVTT